MLPLLVVATAANVRKRLNGEEVQMALGRFAMLAVFVCFDAMSILILVLTKHRLCQIDQKTRCTKSRNRQLESPSQSWKFRSSRHEELRLGLGIAIHV